MKTQARDIPVLNGIRGLAVLVVFMSHASNIFYGGDLFGMGGGQLGVMLFFMLSGFLMAYLYMQRPLTASAMRGFLVNRGARVYPMFLLVVVAAYIVNTIGLQLWVYPIRSLDELLAHLFFVRGVDVLWTIGPEIIFYLLFLVLWRARNCGWGWFAGTVLIMLCMTWLPVNVRDTNSLFALHQKLPFFVVGCLLGMRYEDWLRAGSPGSGNVAVTMAFWASLALFVASFPQVMRLLWAVPKQLTGDPWPDPWAYPYYLAVIGMLFVATVMAQPWLMSNRVAGFIGKISFSFYLWHHAVLENVNQLVPGHPIRAIALAMSITLVLSSLSYATVEVPGRNLLRRLAHARASGDAVDHRLAG